MSAAVVIAALMALFVLWHFFQGDGRHRCVQCGGRGGHRADCPRNVGW